MSNDIDLAWNIVQDEQYNDQKRRKFLSTLYQIDLRYCLYVHIHQELRSVVHRKRIVWLGYRLGASKENIVQDFLAIFTKLENREYSISDVISNRTLVQPLEYVPQDRKNIFFIISRLFN